MLEAAKNKCDDIGHGPKRTGPATGLSQGKCCNAKICASREECWAKILATPVLPGETLADGVAY